MSLPYGELANYARFEFKNSELFGAETLQANTQTAEFSKFATARNDRYDAINDSFNDVLLNTRGFKKVMSKDVQKAEKSLFLQP